MKKKPTVVLTCGVFDLLHPGHIYLFERARQWGDKLVVAVNSDASTRKLKGPTRPVQNESTRMAAVRRTGYADRVVLFTDTNCSRLIYKLRPHVFAKAGYTLATLNEDEVRACGTVGTRIVLLDRLEGHSTTEQIARFQ